MAVGDFVSIVMCGNMHKQKEKNLAAMLKTQR